MGEIVCFPRGRSAMVNKELALQLAANALEQVLAEPDEEFKLRLRKANRDKFVSHIQHQLILEYLFDLVDDLRDRSLEEVEDKKRNFGTRDGTVMGDYLIRDQKLEVDKDE